ncbi:MAG: tetratricopeptide repeat protein [Planctomycetes bacterium]|nr:tetratricopeptide repeat protein [Planctomycetota bacterium]MCB9934306.1 tetratricopeptide repeat protein [Planctomycetota bacterium]
MHAEEHYQFRHAVMRDVAYQLHAPALRGTLHRVALEQYESEIDVDLPEPADKLRTDPLPADSLMAQLAIHARYAQDEPYANAQLLRRNEARYLVRAANYAEQHYDHEQAFTAWRRLADISEGRIRFWALQRLSQTSRVVSRMHAGFTACEEALEMARKELSNKDVVLALAEKGLAHWFDDQPEAACECLEEAVSLFDAEVSKSLEANTLGLLGMVYHQLGRPEEFEDLCLRALELMKQSGDRFNLGVMLQNLGATMLDARRFEESESFLTQAIAVHTELEDDTNLAIGLNNLSMLESERGDYARAIEYAERSMPLLTRVGNRRSLGYAYAARGTALRHSGRLSLAEADIREAVAIHREAGNLSGEASCLCDLGLITTLLGRVAEGRELWCKGMEQIRRLRNEPTAQHYRGEMHAVCAKAGVEAFE